MPLSVTTTRAIKYIYILYIYIALAESVVRATLALISSNTWKQLLESVFGIKFLGNRGGIQPIHHSEQRMYILIMTHHVPAGKKIDNISQRFAPCIVRNPLMSHK